MYRALTLSALTALLAGCGPLPPPELPGNLYEPPVFTPGKLAEIRQAETADHFEHLQEAHLLDGAITVDVHHVVIWEFTTSTSRQEVVAWYREQLPQLLGGATIRELTAEEEEELDLYAAEVRVRPEDDLRLPEFGEILIRDRLEAYTFDYLPADTRELDQVTIAIEEGGFSISESVWMGRRRSLPDDVDTGPF
jgi:hypothetical protein